MLVCQAYCPKDQDQAMRFAAWIHELGGCKGHRLLLIEDVRCAGSPLADEYRKSFDSVEILPFTDRWNRWPHSANACFKMAAWHIEATSKEPWFFIEPDCVVLHAGWLNAFEKEYIDGKQPFLGDYVHPCSHERQRHLSRQS